MADKSKLYQYRVVYTINGGKKQTQGIQSKNPEANNELANEALGLIMDRLRDRIGSEVRLLKIEGLSDRRQMWPNVTAAVAVSTDSGPGLNLSLEGISLTANNTPPDVTANGLPTLDAVNRMKTAELREVADKLGIDHEGMKFPELRSAVFTRIENAIKDAA